MADRRNFLIGAAALTAVRMLGSEPRSVVRSDLALEEDPSGPKVPLTYVGLSYELSQLSDPSFFSETHHDLVAYLKLLAPQGVLRLGGNTSEFCWFRADGSTPAPKLHVPPGDLAANWMPHQLFAIRPAAIDALAGFLKATGWRLIYGLNFGNSTPERAAAEAAYVANAVGDRLEFFQIGNEPDLYTKASNGTRPPGWNFQDYVREWAAYADAVTARVPGARFGGPDVASSDWVVRFCEKMAPRMKERLTLLTGHYYAEGPPDDPRVTIQRLLAFNQTIEDDLRRIDAAAGPDGPKYRMTEGNSCYRGGKPGMSDAFAASLWAADYMLELASLGCVGVNLHGGKSEFLTAGLGGHTPGRDSAKKPQKVASGYYSPIRTEPGMVVRAMPVFYGMKFAGRFAGGQFMRAVCNLSGVNASVYAVKSGERVVIAAVNKDQSKALELKMRVPEGMNRGVISRLTAPGLGATENIRLEGAAIGPHAIWSPRPPVALAIEKGITLIHVPAASAVQVTLG